jgi:Ni/Fe-hydrogenase subunit HybB-like protein
MKTKRSPLTWFRLWLLVLGAFLLAGVFGGGMVLLNGLYLTNLSDLVPWGLWITIDLSAIALSAGAFLFSAVVYLLGLKQFQSLARTAVFVGLIGYSMAMLTLLLDIGRPDRFWHAMLYWNPHSPLWEVTMCVMLYFSVLLLEVAPIFGQAAWMRRRWPKLAARLEGVHKIAPVLAIAGLALSMLHQSSLGATYGVLKARPIWYRPGMAVLFITSAMAAGPSMTIFASWLSSRLTKRATVDEEVIDKASKAVGWILAAYLYLRFWDTLAMSYTFEPGRSEGLQLLTRGQLAFNFWIGEMIVGILIPMIILLSDRLRRVSWLRAMAFLFVIGGLVAYRFDTNIVGLLVTNTIVPQNLTPLYVSYKPSLIEWAAGLGVVAYGLTAFTLGVKYLKVVDRNAGHVRHWGRLEAAPAHGD